MPRVVVLRVEELPRELWFGTTGPLERLPLKRSLAKLEAAGLSPSWSDVEPLLAYLRECVAKLGSYAKCAAVVGATRNMIRDACRGRYVPSLNRLLEWGHRLAEHPGGLRGLLLTIERPAAEVNALRPLSDRELGATPSAGRRLCSRAPDVAAPPLARTGYTQGQDAGSAKPAVQGSGALPAARSKGGGLGGHAPGSILVRAGACPLCGTCAPRGVSPPDMRANTSFTQGEPTATAPHRSRMTSAVLA